MDIRSISNKNRQEVNDFIIKHWFTTDMVVRGQIFDMTVLEGLVMYESETIVGLITYRFENRECEIMSLDSLKENCGIGTELVKGAVKIAREKKCTKIKLITTNDNLNAMRFYQKRGFDMIHLYYNALEASRKLKPLIPQKGDYDIPIKHEIEFEMKLNL